MGRRNALYLMLGVLLLSIGGGAVVGPALSGSLGFGVGIFGSGAVQFGTPQVVSADAAENVLPGGYVRTSSDKTAIVVGSGMPAGSAFRVKLPVTNNASDEVQLKLRVDGLPMGADAEIQGGDLNVYPSMRKSDANLGRLYYGGRAWIEDAAGAPGPGNVFPLFDGARAPGSGGTVIHHNQAVVRDLGPLPPTAPHRGVDRIALHWTTSDSRVAYVSFTAFAQNSGDAGFSRVVRARAVPAGMAAGLHSEGFTTDSRQVWKVVISTYDANRRELPDGSIDLTELEFGSAYDLGVMGCIAPVIVQTPDFRAGLERNTCHQDTPVRSGSRVDTYYMTGRGLKIAEGSGPLPDGAVGLWQITVAHQDDVEFNVVTEALDLRHPTAAATIYVSSPFSSQIGRDTWQLTLAAGQTGVLDVNIALPATLPPSFPGLTFSLAPLF